MAIPNWITLSRSTGSGNDTVIVTISPNTGAARTCTLTVGTGKISKTLSISQEAYVPPVPGNKIFYTSTDGNIVTPYNTTGWTANIISNTYVDGQGCIEFSEEVKKVADYAFYSCDTLQSVILPDGIINIGQSAFSYCESLASINVPPRVASIGNYAFEVCESLTEVTLPNSVTSIGNGAFVDCYSLTSINIPPRVTSIGETTFERCYSLTSINIPLGVTSIGTKAFGGCSSLTEITIPSTVTSIGNYAFENCRGLEKMIMQRTLPPTFGNGILASTTCPIIVPCGSEYAYKTATNFSQYASRIVGDCPPVPTGDTHYLASNLSYDITVRITDDDERTIVPTTTLAHNDSISWEGNDSIIIKITSPTTDIVRVRNDNGDYLTDNIALTPNVEASSPKIVMTGVERLRIVSMLMTVARPSTDNGINNEEENLEENDF